MIKNTFQIRDAKNQSILPPKLRDCWLLGSFDDKFYLASEINSSVMNDDIVVFGYSSKKNIITMAESLKNVCYPESWSQKKNILYVGTRGGLCFLFRYEIRKNKK